MQTNRDPSLFRSSDADARFLEMVQDSAKRQERLKVLERRRMMNTWSLFIFAGTLLVLALAALTSSNLVLLFSVMAVTIAMTASAAARRSDTDTEIKLIKLYILMTPARLK
ncbi:MAG TPA: hypothetical protein VLG46_09150 [Anaerolineae bacterium]|nr:hypothetical protein [Anaerolineae bacterium]